MANDLEYPLEQVLEIKRRRVEAAEKVVKQHQEELEAEQEKLKKAEAERDKVLQHRQDKLDQLRDELDEGTTSPKILQMKRYLEVVDERVQVEEKKVEDQKEQVKVAEDNLEVARTVLKRKRLEVDKLISHRKDWIKEKRLELQVIEGRELDEIGNVSYLIHKRMGM